MLHILLCDLTTSMNWNISCYLKAQYEKQKEIEKNGLKTETAEINNSFHQKRERLNTNYAESHPYQLWGESRQGKKVMISNGTEGFVVSETVSKATVNFVRATGAGFRD